MFQAATTIVSVLKNGKVTCLKDYRPVALTSVAKKCFKKLVMAHSNTIIPEPLHPLQSAYCSTRSTDDAISIELHTALSHLDKRNAYVRMLFIDYSSALNTIVPSKLVTMLGTEHLPLQLDPLLPDRPTPGDESRQQHVRHADPQHGGPQGCVLIYLLKLG